MTKKLSLKQFKSELQKRPRTAHKGDFGHVVIVGGDDGYSGAVRLAAGAALRAGAGLVSVVTHAESANVLNITRPEIMCHAAENVNAVLEKATFVVLGPGLGQSSWGENLFNTVIKTEKPLLIDADGLNFLARSPQQKLNWILTPHPAEAARLLKMTTAEVQANRLSSVVALQKNYQGVAVLKGSGTLIASASAPSSKMERFVASIMRKEEDVSICKAGNPGMATAGMGDVLSGVIASLAAQKIPLANAAKLGVLVHAMAGDLAAKEGGERGMVASDLMHYIRQLVNV
jgi:hydroxyethylthiazole kinase-like uncharacterized protein yjeF